MASTCESPYPYTPSIVLAGIGIGLFTITTSAHLIRMLNSRTWDNVFMILGGSCQLTGYIARAIFSQDLCNKSAYSAQAVLLLLGPTLLMFTVTLSHSRFMRAINAEAYCWIPLSLQRLVYLALNVAFLIVQLAGGIESAEANSRHMGEVGSKLEISAYIMQMVFWCFILAENHWASYKVGAAIKKADQQDLSLEPSGASSFATVKETFPHYKRWTQLFGLAISIIGLGRNLTRLTELGGVGFLHKHEWSSYAFDGYQMIVVMGAWAIWYLPGRLNKLESAASAVRPLEGDDIKSPDSMEARPDAHAFEMGGSNTTRKMS